MIELKIQNCMAKNKAKKEKIQQEPSTQQHIPFAEIRDNVIIMKDGTLRIVILVSSLNFALKSEDEQKGIVQGYVSFLNSIDFELQIVIQSRRLNIEKYLAKLDTLAKQQDNELLRKQTKAYRVFVERLVQQADIMDKKFYVVVPFSPFSDKRRSFWARVREVVSPASIVRIEEAQFQEYKIELMRRVGLVTSGLRSIGLQTNILDTQALIELFYNTYNPMSTQQKRIQNLDAMRVDRSYI